MEQPTPESTPPEATPWYRDSDDAPLGERLQKVLAAHGWGSRRVCEEMIAQGRVRVNDATAVLGCRVRPDNDRVEVDGVPVGIRPGLVHYLVNKPQGVICSVGDTHDRPTIVDLVPPEPRVHPVGRLDLATEGLIIVTNDGALTHAITHPSRGVEKEYLASVRRGAVSAGSLRRLRDGIELDDGFTAPAQVSQPEPGLLRITIHEGRNRQVRRMCDAIGHPVERLIRVRIGPISDRSLAPGTWRYLDPGEVIALSTETGAAGYAPHT
jgi:23S rRNA pseudouridine2605 synthase